MLGGEEKGSFLLLGEEGAHHFPLTQDFRGRLLLLATLSSRISRRQIFATFAHCRLSLQADSSYNTFYESTVAFDFRNYFYNGNMERAIIVE